MGEKVRGAGMAGTYCATLRESETVIECKGRRVDVRGHLSRRGADGNQTRSIHAKAVWRDA